MLKYSFSKQGLLFLLCCVFITQGFPGGAPAGESTSGSFDEGLYRQLAQEYLAEMTASGRVTAPPPSQEDDERLAAYWYAVRKAAVKRSMPWTGKLVGSLSHGSERVKQLYDKNPHSVELLSLCLAFANESKDRAYSPFIERALPFVILAENGHMRGPLSEELQYNFFFPFVRMLSSAASQNEREGGFLGREQSPDRYLFLDTRQPAMDDIRMWASLVRHYGQAEQREGKWAAILKSVSEYEKALSVSDEERMSISEAYERLARIGLKRLVERSALQAKKAYEAARTAFLAGVEKGKQEGVSKDLPEELRRKKAQLERAAATLSGTWKAHKSLCEFYVENHLRESPTYPPARFATPTTPDDFNALAYYQLVVRATLRRYRSEAVKKAIEYTGKALELDPKSARAYALRAWALHRQGQDEAAAEALRQARILDAENAEYLFVKTMLDRRKRKRD